MECGSSEKIKHFFRWIWDSPGHQGAEGAGGTSDCHSLPEDTQSSEWFAAVSALFKNLINGSVRPDNNYYSSQDVMMGCQPRTGGIGARPPVPGEVKEDLPPIKQMISAIDLPGDPRLGKLLFIRQIHSAPIFYVNYAEEILELNLQAGHYQEQVYSALLHLKPSHIFLEGNSKDEPPGDRRGLKSELAATFEKNKNLPWPSEIDWDGPEGRTLYLGMFGAGLVYTLNHPHVFLHKTSTPELNRRLMEVIRLQDQRIISDSEFNDFAIETREAVAVEEMVRFFKANPGMGAILIYGSAHRFCDDFLKMQFPLKMTSTWFPNPLHGEIPPSPCGKE
jgi:hypothetical protein